MNRVLKRPMFRMGGSTGTGITSGLDRPGYKDAGTVQAALDTTQKSLTALDQFREKQSGFMPGALPGFLTSFGLNLLATPPRGNIFQTAAVAAQDPFKTFQASQLADREDRRKRAEDIFSTALASEYDLERERIENPEGKGNEKTFAKDSAAGAVRAIYSTQIGAIENKIEVLDKNDPNYQTKLDGFNQQISDLRDKQRDEVKSIYLSQKTQKEFLREVIIKLLQNNDPEDIAQYFPNFNEIMGGNFKLPEEKADGGRIGYKIGSEPMMDEVVEQKKETGEVQDLSYTELRTRLPQEISNEIVMLLANSKQALLDFANIQTGEDIASFNQQYNVNLSLPQGA